jgi:pimeloyl-ACP methyl ester carboxylesterase
MILRLSPSRFAIAAALALALPVRADELAERRYGTLTFAPCALGAEGSPRTVEAQCTTLAVPEDRAAPGGRTIELAIAWIPSSASEPADDPVFMLAGGPGQGARASYVGVEPAFRPLLKRRHVILVDQRGTGDSHPLRCTDREGKSNVADLGDESPAALADFARRCLEGLDADPRHYTTEDGVADLDAVRQALAVEQVSLIGISYGTRVAQTYLRRHPAHARAVVLDGVVPSELILGADHAKNLDAALDLQFARCAATPACAEHYGAPRANLAELMQRLRESPPQVRYRDPLSGEMREDPFTVRELAGVVRLFAYAPQTAAMLPLALHDAAHGRPEALMAQSRMLQSFLGEQIMHGMQLSVICTEDAPFLRADPADDTRTLGNAIVAITEAQCAVWPHDPPPADVHAPLVSDKPVLVLSGEFDPVTPPRYGEQVVKGFANGRHLVARGTGHNVLVVGCAPRLVAEFFKSADARGLDASCLDELTYVAPFAGYYGWEP